MLEDQSDWREIKSEMRCLGKQLKTAAESSYGKLWLFALVCEQYLVVFVVYTRDQVSLCIIEPAIGNR